jgi:hypothetical protein
MVARERGWLVYYCLLIHEVKANLAESLFFDRKLKLGGAWRCSQWRDQTRWRERSEREQLSANPRSYQLIFNRKSNSSSPLRADETNHSLSQHVTRGTRNYNCEAWKSLREISLSVSNYWREKLFLDNCVVHEQKNFRGPHRYSVLIISISFTRLYSFLRCMHIE